MSDHAAYPRLDPGPGGPPPGDARAGPHDAVPLPPHAPERPDGHRELLDRLDEVVFETDPLGNWTYLNAAWTRSFGWPLEESLGTSFLQYVHPEEREHTLSLFMAVVAGGSDHCHHRTRYESADGSYRTIEIRARLLRNEQGQIVGNVGTILDVSGRESAQRSLTEHGQMLELLATDDPTLADALPIGVLIYGGDFTVRRVSPLLEHLLGPDVRVGQSIDRLYELLASRCAEGGVLGGNWGLVATCLRTGRPQYTELRLGGGTRPRVALRVSLLAGSYSGSGAGEGGLTMVVQDVSDLWRAELQYAQLAQLAQLALCGGELAALLQQAARIAAETLDAPYSEVLELVDDAAVLLPRAAFGWRTGAEGIGDLLLGPTGSLLVSTLAQDAPVVLEDARAGPGGSGLGWPEARAVAGSLTVSIGSKESRFGLLGVHTDAPRRFRPDEVEFVRSIATVLSMAIERSRAEEQVSHQALHDSLTGLGNRILLLDHLELALANARRTGRRAGLLLMDLDRFKEINDTLGHDVGDEVLRVVGKRLEVAVRASDTVARLGGDEFAVVLPELGDPEDGMRVAEKLREESRRPIEHGGVSLHVEGSVGLAVCPEHGADAITLLKRADVAMYRAKRLATGVASYCASSDQLRPERLAYAGALQKAIESDQLVLHYQPRVDLSDGRVCAFEALVRWQHPEQGLLAPGLFIPLAEQTGLIEPLTHRVIRLALHQARVWQAAGRHLPVAVNISARVLHDTDLVGLVTRELREAGLPASALELELTESAIMSSPANALAVTTDLRDAGIRLSIDDFGTGYSSLAWLQNLPVDQLKIDKSFVRSAAGNPRDAVIVRSVVDLGHNLGLQVVGEGVETAEAWELLRELGCDEGQGFFFGRPTASGQGTASG